jgi:hypothetical protein
MNNLKAFSFLLFGRKWAATLIFEYAFMKALKPPKVNKSHI